MGTETKSTWRILAKKYEILMETETSIGVKPVNNRVQVIIHSILLTPRARILGLVLKPVNNQVQVIMHYNFIIKINKCILSLELDNITFLWC